MPFYRFPKCEECFKPKSRRLALFQKKDDYECYADRYVKCFWNLCDKQNSTEDFISKPKAEVITTQPKKTIALRR